MAEDIKTEDDEYEYIKLSEGEDLPEGVEYEYVEEIEDLAETPKESVSYSGELVKLRDVDVDLDDVLDTILEDKPNQQQIGSTPRPPVAGGPRVEKKAEAVAVEVIEEKPAEMTKFEPVARPAVVEEPKSEPVAVEEVKIPLTSEELLAMAKEAVLSKTEKRSEPKVVVAPETEVQPQEQEEVEKIVETSEFNLDGEIEEEMVSMDDLMDQPVDLEDHVIDMGTLTDEPETVIENMVSEPVVDEMAVATMMDENDQEYEYVEVYDEVEELDAMPAFQVSDAETVPNGAVMFMGNNGVEFCNDKEAIYIDVENPVVWNLIIFDRKLVALDEGIKEVNLPKENKWARYATLVKNGQEMIDLFNEEKFLFDSPKQEIFKGKEHFIYGKMGQTSGLVINDVVTIPLNKIKGKQISSKKPISGMIAGNGAVLYFNGAFKIIS